MKTITKLVSLFVFCGLLLCTTILPTEALTITELSDSYLPSSDDFDQYAQLMAEQYNYICFDSSKSSLGISQGFDVYNDQDDSKRIYFIFDGSVCVGQMTTAYVDGSFASSYTEKEVDIISDSLRKNTQFCLVAENDCLWYLSHETNVILEGNVFLQYSSPIERVSYQMESLTLTALELSNYSTTRSYGSSFGSTSSSGWGTLNVPYVANANSPDDQSGLCWAACASSIVAYRKSIAAKTAIAVYNDVKASVQNPDYIPSSAGVWRVFQYYGVTYNEREAGATFDEVKSIINQEHPIYAGLKRNQAAHAVVICGYQSAQGGYYFFTLMDPNVTSKVVVAVNPSSTSFTYATSYGHTYTTWTRMFW